MVRDAIRDRIQTALSEWGADVSFAIMPTENQSFGAYATNAALVSGKKLRKAPRELADMLAKKLAELPFIEKAESAGPGFVNIHLSRDFFADTTERALQEDWGKGDAFAGKRIMVEYTQPNPFKEFHIGHLMSNAVGESLSRLIEWSGAEVKRANYQGDVGPHVAKCIWGLRQLSVTEPSASDLGKAYVLGSSAYEDNVLAKQEIDVINKAVYERNDQSINDIYDKGRETSLRHFEVIYKKLGTTFDFYFFESETAKRGLDLIKKNMGIVFEESDGVIIFRGEKYGLHTRVFINRLGLPTYETKDIGLIELKRASYPFDISLTVTAIEQDEYFKVMRQAAELVFGDIQGKVQHVVHGLLRLTEGKMSSRKGNVITGASLIADTEDMVASKMKDKTLMDRTETTEAVAVAGIKYAVLRQSTGRDIVFDPEKSLSFEGDSGPYLQYAHVRACAIRKRADEAKLIPQVSKRAALSSVEKLLIYFPEVLERAALEFEPHYLTTYLTELAGAFNSWYAQERIVEDSEEGRHRLAVTEAFRITMERGLWLLGIRAPQEM